MKEILVTGGFGFVGQHLIRGLVKEGHKVTCLDIIKKDLFGEEVKTICLDLANYNPKEEGLSKGFDIIFHLASFINVNEMIKNPKIHILNNINSTLNLLEDIRLNNPNCLLVFASSDKIYGNAKKREVTEDDLNIPVDPYGSSKFISELLIYSYQLNYNLKNIILRCGNIFGPGQSPGLFIPSVITKIIKGDDILKVGNLNPYRNFVYIEDAINAYVKSIKNDEAVNKTFNISSYNIRIADVLKEVTEIAYKSLGKKIEIIQDKDLYRKSELGAKRFMLNCEKANKTLKWEPSYTFQEAIKITFESYLK